MLGADLLRRRVYAPRPQVLALLLASVLGFVPAGASRLVAGTPALQAEILLGRLSAKPALDTLPDAQMKPPAADSLSRKSALARAYAMAQFGGFDFGDLSPCGCGGPQVAFGGGVLISKSMRVGVEVLRFATSEPQWNVSAELAYSPLRHRRLELIGSTGLGFWRKPEIFGEQEYRRHATISQLGIGYRPFAARRHAKAWQLYVGYLHHTTVERLDSPDGQSGNRIRVTHIGWQARIGYSLYRRPRP